MARLLITYDLRKPGRDYEALYDYLADFDSCHALESVWFVSTEKTPEQVRDEIAKIVDRNDAVFVLDTNGTTSAWRQLLNGCGDWYKDHRE